MCLSVLLTRPDMETAHLDEFVGWATALLDDFSQLPPQERSNLSQQYFLILGVLHCLFQIFKLGHRVKLLPHGPVLLPYCLRLAEGNSQTSTRKLLTKLVQRIGMNYLPPRIASWRYMRGNRSLNLVGSKPTAVAATVTVTVAAGPFTVQDATGADEDEDDDVPDEMEDVVDRLLISLQDKDTVVRWSAAKGIGRITMRLSQDLAGDIVDAVVDIFADPEADSSWHGGCLALAELSRRGLLLPDRLAVVMPYIERAIRFDIRRGKHSIGAHVRDAACYVCWAFSRAYSPVVMAPFIRALTTALVTTALFDREVNCRRAASAAYQETVGRQGDQNVPNGISIITIADYFSVGNRYACFTTIAASVAALDPKLNESLMVHLATSTVKHWDRDMRELAGKALASLAPLNTAAAVEHLGRLVGTCTAANLNLRHGSILATAELLFALVSDGQVLAEPLVASIVGIVAAIDKGRLFRDGGELIREAVCRLINSVARSRIPLPVKVQAAYVEALNEHLRQPFEPVQFAARDALREFLHAHFSSGDAPSERLQELTVLKYVKGLLTDNNVSVTRGYALALGVLPARLVLLPEGRINQVLSCLRECCSAAHRISGEYDANTCCNSVAALGELAERLSTSTAFTAEHTRQCFDVFFHASDDYSVDKRGDTGSWSRTAAMLGLQRLLYACLRNERDTVQSSNSSSTDVQYGSVVGTCVGSAVVSKVLLKTASLAVVQVRFPPGSLGESLQQLQTPSASSYFTVVIKANTKNFVVAPPSRERTAGDVAPLWPLLPLLQETCPRVLSVVFKQLSEKLDAVREVAGGVLLSLIKAYNFETEEYQRQLVKDDVSGAAAPAFLFNFPEFSVVIEALSTEMHDGGDCDFSKINWANPAHVYPIMCRVLKSPAYFPAVLSGLVLSVGGLSETTSKCSAKALLAYCEQAAAAGDSLCLEGLASALVRLMEDHEKNDRVTVPTLKTLVLVMNEGVLDSLSPPFLARFTATLYTVLAAETKGSTNLAKLCVALDLLVRALSLHPGSSRAQGLQVVFSMLTHRYPRVRKRKWFGLVQLFLSHISNLFILPSLCSPADCAELLYISFLADTHSVSSLADSKTGDDAIGSTESTVCGFFSSQERLERALQVLSGCSWDGDGEGDRARLFEGRIELTELAGFAEVAAAVRVLSTQRGPALSAREGPDEHDTYDALVREAGKPLSKKHIMWMTLCIVSVVGRLLIKLLIIYIIICLFLLRLLIGRLCIVPARTGASMFNVVKTNTRCFSID